MRRPFAARLLPHAVLVTACLAVACANEVGMDDGTGAAADDGALPVDSQGDGAGADDDGANDGAGAGADDDGAGADDDGAGTDDDAAGADDDGAGVDAGTGSGSGSGGGGVDAGSGTGTGTGTGTGGGDGGVPGPNNDPGPPPAQTTQSCVEWTECGPWYVNENSGFDCVSGQCECDATGQWAQACTNGGAVWNGDTCFCYWGTSALPSTSPDPEPDDEVYCWWDWWGRDCEPDTWVDTSYYEKVCYGDDCYWEYVDDGYYTDGDCEEQWVSRCSDGTIWRYF